LKVYFADIVFQMFSLKTELWRTCLKIIKTRNDKKLEVEEEEDEEEKIDGASNNGNEEGKRIKNRQEAVKTEVAAAVRRIIPPRVGRVAARATKDW
jgi:hypothetical protein